MCGRFTVTTKDTKSIADRFQVELEKALQENRGERVGQGRLGRAGGRRERKEKSPPGLGRFNVAPTQEILVVRSSPDEAEAADGEREARLMRWGLVPVWAKDLKVGYRMINAKVENLTKSRAYGPLVGKFRHRCLIVADGFYEWMKAEDPKQPRQPWRFTVDGGEPFAFAGLCTRKEWDDPEERGVDPDGYLYSATIITTTPNAVVKPVHDRMPAILAEPRGRGGLARPAALDRGGDRDVRAARSGPDGRRARQPGAQQGRQRDGRGAGAAGRAAVLSDCRDAEGATSRLLLRLLRLPFRLLPARFFLASSLIGGETLLIEPSVWTVALPAPVSSVQEICAAGAFGRFPDRVEGKFHRLALACLRGAGIRGARCLLRIRASSSLTPWIVVNLSGRRRLDLRAPRVR